jgi:hypothetical protein
MFLIAFSLGQQLSSQARKRIKGLFVGLKTFFQRENIIFPSISKEVGHKIFLIRKELG